MAATKSAIAGTKGQRFVWGRDAVKLPRQPAPRKASGSRTGIDRVAARAGSASRRGPRSRRIVTSRSTDLLEAELEARIKETKRGLGRDRPMALSLDEAADSLSISRDSFERHVAPELRLLSVGRRVVVPVSEIERWIGLHAALAPSEMWPRGST